MGKLAFTDGDFEFNSVTYYVRNFNIDESLAEINATDTGTSGDGNEYTTGRYDRTFDFERVSIQTDSGLPVGTEYAGTFTSGTGSRTFAGNMILTSRKFVHSLDDVILEQYTGRINGTHTITPES